MDTYQKLLNEKAKNKRELLGKMFFPRTPVVLLDFSDTQNIKDYTDLIQGLNEINVVTFVVTTSDEKRDLPQGEYIHYAKPEEQSRLYPGVDMVVRLDSDVEKIWQKGCVPVSKLDGDGTINYNPLQEKGNGFYFKNPTKWEVFTAIIRALETYQFPYDWENLIREILKKVTRN